MTCGEIREGGGTDRGVESKSWSRYRCPVTNTYPMFIPPSPIIGVRQCARTTSQGIHQPEMITRRKSVEDNTYVSIA